VTLSSALLCGCRQGGEAPTVLALDQVPKAVEEAFKTAKPEVKAAVGQVVAALQAKDKVKAELAVQNLAARTDLNKAQRALTGQLLVTVNQELQAAASSGDEQAAEVVRYKHLNK